MYLPSASFTYLPSASMRKMAELASCMTVSVLLIVVPPADTLKTMSRLRVNGPVFSSEVTATTWSPLADEYER